MTSLRFLYDAPTPLIVGILLLAMIVAAEVARRAGGRHVADWAQLHDVQLNLTAAMLALFALMLAFSFSMSLNRFQARQAALLAEARAIDAVALLTDQLTPEARGAVIADLRLYTDQRISFLTVGHDPSAEQDIARSSREIAERIWAVVGQAESHRVPVGQNLSLLARAVIDMIAAAEVREAARATLVPQPVLVMLFILAILSSTMVSYNFGASAHGNRRLTVTLMLLICMIVYIVIDLDRPRRGLMQLDPAPLIELRSQIEVPDN